MTKDQIPMTNEGRKTRIGQWCLVISRRRPVCPMGLKPLELSRFPVCATKKEVSCSPQQEASRFWLFRTWVAPHPKTHSRYVGIGSRSSAALGGSQPPTDSPQLNFAYPNPPIHHSPTCHSRHHAPRDAPSRGA